MKKMLSLLALLGLGLMGAGCTITAQELAQATTVVGTAAFDAACSNLSAGDMAFQNAVASRKITSQAAVQGERSAVLAVQTACDARPLTSAKAIQTALAAVSKIAAYELAANVH